MRLDLVLIVGTCWSVGLASAAWGATLQNSRNMIGAVIVSELFADAVPVGADPDTSGPKTKKELPLYVAPTKTAATVSLKNELLRSIVLVNQQAAIVYQRKDNWFEAETSDTHKRVWLERKPTEFRSTESILEMSVGRELTTNQLWNGKWYKSPDAATAAGSQNQKLAFSVSVKKKKWVGNQLWLDVDMIQKKKDPSAKMTASMAGWIGLFSDSGEWILDRNVYW